MLHHSTVLKLQQCCAANLEGHVTSYINHTNGNPSSVTLPYPAGANPADYTTSFTYDEAGNQTSVTLPSRAR